MARVIGYVPSEQQFTEGDYDTVRLYNVAGGTPRIRKDKARTNPTVSLVWRGDRLLLSSLLGVYTNSRDDEWQITLVSSVGGYAQHTCRLLPGTFQWANDGGDDYRVSAQFEIMGVV